jgi:choline dehydrogenase-like flavoprotein
MAPRPNISPPYQVISWPVLKFAAPRVASKEPNVFKHFVDGPRQIIREFRRKLKKPVTHFKLNHMTEQVPNPDSRIRLSGEKDRLGRNRIQLDWRLSGIDVRSIIRSQEIIDEQLRKAGLGQLQITMQDESNTQGVQGGWHHMGTTRMHADPKQGVVDTDCRVHGISNLYIAGPSVFPTCGYANPVLTIVALSIRLADKIKTLMGQ